MPCRSLAASFPHPSLFFNRELSTPSRRTTLPSNGSISSWFQPILPHNSLQSDSPSDPRARELLFCRTSPGRSQTPRVEKLVARAGNLEVLALMGIVENQTQDEGAGIGFQEATSAQNSKETPEFGLARVASPWQSPAQISSICLLTGGMRRDQGL